MRWIGLLMFVLGLVVGAVVEGPGTPTLAYSPATCDDNTNVRFYATPAEPDAQTPVTIGFRGQSGDSCTPAYVRHEVRPGAIDIFASEPCDLICAAVITPWDIGASVGALAAGGYTVRLLINTTPAYTGTLTVAPGSATPAPSTTPTLPPPTATTTATASATATVTVSATPSVTASATSTASATPTMTATATPTPTATTTPAPTHTPTVCDPTNRAAVCNGAVLARVYLDLRCDGFFNRGVDWPLADVTLTLTLPDGSSRSVQTGPEGEVVIPAVSLLPGQSLSLTAPETPPAPAWVEQGGLSLAPCGPTTVTLSRANFSLFGTASVDIRYGLQRSSP